MNNPDYGTALQLVFFIGITLVLLIVFLKPAIGITKVLFRATAYSCLIYLSNVVTASFGFSVGLNVISSALCGFLGVYGLILTYVTRLIY